MYDLDPFISDGLWIASDVGLSDSRERSVLFYECPRLALSMPPLLIPLCPPLLIVCTRLIIVCNALLYQLKFLISEMQSIDSYHEIVVKMFCYICFRIGYCIIKFISMEKTTHEGHLFLRDSLSKSLFGTRLPYLCTERLMLQNPGRAELTVPTYTRSRIC